MPPLISASRQSLTSSTRMQEDNLVVFSLIPAETTLCVDLGVLWVVQGLHKLQSSLQLPVASNRESCNSGVKIRPCSSSGLHHGADKSPEIILQVCQVFIAPSRQEILEESIWCH